MDSPTANPAVDTAMTAAHKAEVRKRALEPRKQPNPRVSFTARQERAFISAQKKTALYTDLEEEWARQESAANELAETHGIKKQEMQRRVQQTSAFKGQKRGANAWNAYIHIKAMDVNKDVADGEKIRLQELQDLAIKNDYLQLNEETKENMKTLLEDVRAIRKKTTRNRATAVMHDVRGTTDKVFNELNDLNQRCDMASMCLVVRTTPTNSTKPRYFIDDNSRAFIETTFNKTIEEFTVLYESYMVGRVRGMAQTSTANKIAGKARIRAIVRDKLRTITSDPTAEMSWKQYEERIVNVYSVCLKNWPKGIAFNPDSMSSRDVRIVLMALEKADCEWVVLGSEELENRQTDIQRRIETGELTIAERKRRSDAGIARGPYKKARTSAGASGNDNDDKSDDDDNSSAPRKRKSAPSHVSPAIVPSDSEEDGGDVNAAGENTLGSA